MKFSDENNSNKHRAYSHNKNNKKPGEPGEPKKPGKFKKFIKTSSKVLAVIMIAFLVIGISILGYLTYKYMPEYRALSSEADMVITNMNNKTFTRLGPTKVIGSDGEVVREFKHATYKYIDGKDIPKDVKQAFISIEDKQFYKHRGIDIKANIRAFKALLSNKGEITQGASTITQQLVKNIFLTNEQSYERKIKEIILSLKLEKALTKDEILEYYVNNIYFANGAYGIQTASDKYFSKDVKDLSVSEVSFLAAIPNNPTVFNPMTNKDNTIKRRNLIINHMLEDEYLTTSQSRKSIKEEIELSVKPEDEYVPENYEVSYVINSATKIVMEFEGFEIDYKFDSDEDRSEYNKKYQEKYKDVNERIRAGGYEIRSTIQADKQYELQASLDKGLSEFTGVNSETGLYETQGAGVTIDNQTNELVAIVGGRSQEGVDNTYNRAFLSHRQPGSVIKPIVAYGIEIDKGMLSSATHNDSFVANGPKNAGRGYLGNMTAREALERSVNTIPFNMVKNRGAGPAHDYMTDMEFSKIVDGDDNAGIAVGGFTYGTTPLEINGAYAAIANDGKYVKPTGISEITFNEDLNVYTNNKKTKLIYDDGTAYLLTDMLKGVMRADWGTGKGLDFGDMPIAGKTGTTDDSKDGWFSGYSPYYTTTIWIGNDLPKTIKGLYGGTYPGEIWKDYMSKIHKDLPIKDFKIPKGTRKMYLNARTGDVSDTPRRGFNHYEIIPGRYRIEREIAETIRVEKARQAEVARQKAERDRMLAEMTAEFNRKNEFRSKYGVEEEDEWANQETAKANIREALGMGIYSEADYNQAVKLLDYGRDATAKVKVPEDKADLTNRVKEGYSTLAQKKQDMFKRRAEEAARRKAAEEARVKAAEEARIKAIEDEKNRVEREAQRAIERENERRAQEIERKEAAERERIEREQEKEEKEHNHPEAEVENDDNVVIE